MAVLCLIGLQAGFQISLSLIHSPFGGTLVTLCRPPFTLALPAVVFLVVRVRGFGGGRRSAFLACGSRDTHYERILQLVRVTLLTSSQENLSGLPSAYSLF